MVNFRSLNFRFSLGFGTDDGQESSFVVSSKNTSILYLLNEVSRSFELALVINSLMS